MSAVVKENENQIIEFNEFESKLSEFKSQYDNVTYDLTDPKQDKKARSDKYAIAKVISALDEKHKEIKAPLKERVDLIDGARKRIKDQLLEVQGKIKSQIEAHEAKIREREEMLQARVDAIRDLSIFGEYETPNSEQLTERLNKAKAIDIEDGFEDRKADAALAQTETIKLLDGRLSERLKYEKEQEELERLRKEAEERERAEREEKIRKEAERESEERARKEIEDAKRKQEEAEKEAKLAAERATQQERERAEKERREQEEKAEKERKAEEAKKAKQKHREKIHGEAKAAFVAHGFDDGEAENIVTLIKDGKINNVTINY